VPQQATHQLSVKLSDEEFARFQAVRERLQPLLAESDPSYQVTNHDVFLQALSQALSRLERRLDKLEKKAKKGKKAHARQSATRSTASDQS
jgi:hypothetical protein